MKKSFSTIQGTLAVALLSIFVLTGAVLTPTGTIQKGDINANGFSLTNAATLSATNGNFNNLFVTNSAAARTNLGVEAALGNPSTNGFILSSTTGGARSWIALPSGVVAWELKTSGFTAVAGHKYQIDTSGGAVTVTLPATMAAMDRIDFEDLKLSWNSNNVTFSRNGNKINGGTANYTASVIGSKISATAADTGATFGWSIK